MKLNSLTAASLLVLSALVLTGCDQAEKSAQQLMGKAAETAKQAIDDTHKAAEQALNDATSNIVGNKEKPAGDDSEKKESSSQEI
ncbi:hypothetical protein BK659_17325 [Pseudomonas brassicacearum]|uniref:Lipoprotein n=1 Tax=Pseudomonas brassicacearum TaxID=930166 RepID=A0A423H462_9PSED|nr:hypothetical protein [Pseudomonas brassicacearum]RON08001.1 hypothetical protein BK659_17325 [Pseudomonas brassicacearum]